MSLMNRIELYVNDDYATADGRQLQFIDDDASWPTSILEAGLVVSFIVEQSPHGTAVFTVTGSVASSTLINVQLTTANTTLMTAGKQYKYRLVAVVSGRDMTLDDGVIEAK